MSRQQPEQTQFTFQDIAACFSEEEWKLLHEWQKELYENVMKDIHQALLSLGPMIATSVFSLRAKEKHDLCPKGNEDAQRRYSINPSPSDLIDSPGVLFRVNQEENTCLKDLQYTEGREINDCLGTGFPSLNAGSFLRLEDESTANSIDHLGAEVGESHTEPSAVILFRIKEEDDTYSLEDQQNERREGFIKSTGEGSGNRKREAGYSVACTEKSTTRKGMCGKSTVTVLKNTKKGTHSRSQVWSESNQEMGGEKSTPCESGFMNPEYSKFYQETSNIERSDTYTDGESDLQNANLFTCQPNTQNPLRPYACSECAKSFKTKYNLTIHLRTHSGERPYHCTVCEKTFSLKHHVTRHERTHMGERPYQCTKCEKSFSLIGSLSNHQRTHMASDETTQRGGTVPMVNKTWRN